MKIAFARSCGRMPRPTSVTCAVLSSASVDVTRIRPTSWPRRRTIISRPGVIPSLLPLLSRTSSVPSLFITVAIGKLNDAIDFTAAKAALLSASLTIASSSPDEPGIGEEVPRDNAPLINAPDVVSVTRIASTTSICVGFVWRVTESTSPEATASALSCRPSFWASTESSGGVRPSASSPSCTSLRLRGSKWLDLSISTTRASAASLPRSEPPYPVSFWKSITATRGDRLTCCACAYFALPTDR